jgi:hypothetical protein
MWEGKKQVFPARYTRSYLSKSKNKFVRERDRERSKRSRDKLLKESSLKNLEPKVRVLGEVPRDLPEGS